MTWLSPSVMSQWPVFELPGSELFRIVCRQLGLAIRGLAMKSVLAVAVFVLTAAVVPASAQKMNADDIKWINQCIDDNKGEAGATPAIARKYCSCMNEKMDSNETKSITQWEKSHPRERDACSRQAGWK
jgi:hypothetical protein